MQQILCVDLSLLFRRKFVGVLTLVGKFDPLLSVLLRLLLPRKLSRLKAFSSKRAGSRDFGFRLGLHADAVLLHLVFQRCQFRNTLLFRKLLEELGATSLVVLLDNIRPFAAHEVSVLTAQFLGFSLRSRVTLLGLQGLDVFLVLRVFLFDRVVATLQIAQILGLLALLGFRRF